MIRNKRGDPLAKVAGHPMNYLMFRPLCRCGDIDDGVGLSHWRVEDPKGFQDAEGGWVIPFADLEEMYMLAKAVRPSLGVVEGMCVHSVNWLKCEHCRPPGSQSTSGAVKSE